MDYSNSDGFSPNMYEYQQNLHNLLTWFLSPQSKVLDKNGFHNVTMIASNIVSGYKNLTLKPLTTNIVKKKIPVISEELYLNHNDAWYLRPIIDLKKHVNKYLNELVLDFYVMTSMVTMDYSIGWSDLDTFVVIKKKTVTNVESLLKLRNHMITAYEYLTRLAPLQTHGIILCTEFDLYSYPSHFMPANIFDHAISLLQGSSLKFHCKQHDFLRSKQIFSDKCKVITSAHKTGVFRHHAYNNEYLLGKFANHNNGMYQLKYFLDFIMILPSYFLESIGAPTYKKESFKKITEFFTISELEFIYTVSSIRIKWPENESFPYSGNAIPSWLMEKLGDDYFENGYQLVSVMLDKISSFNRET